MSLTYKSSEVANFAQGEMAMFSTYVAFMFLVTYQLPFWIAFTGAMVFAFLLGVFLEFALIRQAKEPNVLNLLIITLGFQIFLYGLAGWKWGADQRILKLPISSSETVDIAGFTISQLNMATVIVAIALMGLIYLFLTYTKIGLAIKATQQNTNAAKINGIPTNRIVALTFGISAVIGGVAGVIMAPIATLDPNMMVEPLLKGFAAAVLGGFNSLGGVVAGAFILGIIENLFGFYISTEFKSVVAFLIIVLVLYFRPSGTFGGLKAVDDVSFEVHLNGEDITGLKPHVIAGKGLSRTFQNLELFSNMTTMQNLLLGRHIHMKTNLLNLPTILFRKGKAARDEISHRERVEHIIDLLDLQSARNRFVSHLPYGRQKVVELGRALALEPDILLLDEPAAGLNLEEKEELVFWIKDIKKEFDVTILMIEHNMQLVTSISDRIMALNFGKNMVTGTADEVVNHPEVIKAYLG
ncbi:braF [Symbiodinium microadriaticum]|nr:braF [Symbiodinium microadriaticum]